MLRCFLKCVGLAIGVMALSLPHAALGETLSGPVINEGLTVDLVDLHQVPFSSANRPHTRINLLREAPDGSGRIFINDLAGPFYVIDGGQIALFVDLSDEFQELKTSPGVSSGFVSFALHPEFATNGLFYTVHSENVASTPPNLGPALSSSIEQHSVLTEWQATDPSSNVFSGNSRELMRIAAPKPFHPLGEIAFRSSAQSGDADYGLLYLAGGDYGAGTTGQPEQLQRLDTPLGTVMRIDPLGGPFERDGINFQYGIPTTNPYANDGDPSTLGEIYAYGFRNGHRISWDTVTETAFVSDIGQGNIEEVNILEPGENYGWPLREGTFALDVDVDRETVFPLPADDATFGFRYPAAQYDHEEGLAIAGGFAYRGTAIPGLQGRFVFGDIVSGRMFYANIDDLLATDDGNPSTTAPLYELNLTRQGQATTLLQIVRDALGDNNISRTDLRFGVDEAGEIHVTTKQDGFIRKLAPPPGQLYFDDFDRGSLGPNWVVDNLQFAVLGNELAETGPKKFAPAQMRWRGGDFGGHAGAEQYEKVQIRGPLTTTPAGFIVRANAPTGPLAGHYEIHFKRSSGQWRWEYYDPAWQATLGSCAGDGPLTADDWIGVTVTGAGSDTEVSVYRWDADPDGGGSPNPELNWGQPDCLMQSASGPFADTGGYGGIRFYGSDPADSRADNWYFGSFTALSTPPADALRGGLLWDRWWAVNGAPEPPGTHPLYPGSGQQQGSTTFRCKECHGWDYKGVDGAYASGSHFTGIKGVSGSALSPTEMFDLISGDSVPDGHGFASLGLVDQDIWDLVEFLQNEVVNTDAFIDSSGYFIGDAVQGEANYATGSCNYCHGDDGTAINFGTPEDPEWVGTIALNNPWEFLHKVRFGDPGTSMPTWVGAGGSNQGAADLGLYAQTSLPVDCGDVGPGICVASCIVDADCDDGAFCNGAETCVADACVPGAPACVDLAHCDESGDVCLACVADFECNDGVFCNGSELCAAGSCTAGTEPCVDSAHCDETGQLCVACLMDAECDDGISCNGFETCSAGVCAPGVDPCPGQICDEATQVCTPPTFNQYTDGFDRPTLGPDWVVDNLEFAIVGSALAETGPSTFSPAQMRWQGGTSNGDSGSPNQFAKLQIVGPLTSTLGGFIVRANTPTEPLATHYELHFQRSAGQWRWEYYNPMWQATLGVCPGDGSPSELDWIGVTVTGVGPDTEVSFYRWDADPDNDGPPDPAANWGAADCILQSSDGPFADTGTYGGIRFYGSDAADSRVDNWSFGAIEPSMSCAVDAECDDGAFCNGVETCVAGACLPGAGTCVDLAHCDEGSDTCLACVSDAECDDGISCNGFETCNAGTCAVGIDPCPGGICNEADQSCTPAVFTHYNDDFDRGSLGPDWVVDNLEFAVINEELAETAPSTFSPAQMRWQGGASGGNTGTQNQYAKIQIRSPLTSTPAGFILRANAASEPLAAHYEVHIKQSTAQWRWEYYNPTWQATLGSCSGDGSLSELDWIGITITDIGPQTQLALYRWDSNPDGAGPPDPGANWGAPDCILQSANGPFADTGTYGGIRFYGSDSADSRADNWFFGGLSPADSAPNDPDFAEQWGLHNEGQTGGTADADIDSLEAWTLTKGSPNVIVAILDTGIDTSHEDLVDNLWINANEIPGNGIDDDNNGYVDDTIGWDFYNDDNDPFDDGGHGTHLAGIIGAVGNNGIGVTGVSHAVRIMPLKITNDSQAGTIDGAIAAINYAIAMGAHVISNSWAASAAWGEPGWNQPGFAPALQAAIEAANAAGILFVATAGNSGKDRDQLPLFPGSYDNENIVNVAATDNMDGMPTWSSFGPTAVDVAAPGVGIVSTVPFSCSLLGPPPGGGTCDGSGYLLASGTSMSTAYVAGVAALIRARFPSIDPAALKDRLIYSVDVLPDLQGITVSEGRVNAASALEYDTVLPGIIVDLAVVGSSSSSITLGFTAPGDDGVAGRARAYDVRYSTATIDAGNIADATRLPFAPRPLDTGSTEVIEVVGLDASTTYYLAVRGIDNVGNVGAISNATMGTTGP